jgi:hypothetical protein
LKRKFFLKLNLDLFKEKELVHLFIINFKNIPKIPENDDFNFPFFQNLFECLFYWVSFNFNSLFFLKNYFSFPSLLLSFFKKKPFLKSLLDVCSEVVVEFILIKEAFYDKKKVFIYSTIPKNRLNLF